MDFSFLKDAFLPVFNHFKKNGATYAKYLGGMIFASAVTATACHLAFKKIEAKHRKEDAERYKEAFAKQLKELEKKYQHNEYLLKKRINELCDEFGIDHVC